jgi:hypothetical protein
MTTSALQVWQGVKPGSRIRFDSRGDARVGVPHIVTVMGDTRARAITLCGRTIRPLTGWDAGAWPKLTGRCSRCVTASERGQR